jgi:hypothetical protein
MGDAPINFNHVQFGNDFHNVLTYIGREKHEKYNLK